MKADNGDQTLTKDGRRQRDCGYQYMTPSYVPVGDEDTAGSYLVVSDALLENSSAHGLPTFYLAKGLTDSSVAHFYPR